MAPEVDGGGAPEVNPTRRSRFSLPWRAGRAGDDEMDGRNDRLLADGDSSSATERARASSQCERACADKRCGRLGWGCCGALMASALVYGTLLYRVYAGLQASLPGLVIQPVRLRSLCQLAGPWSSRFLGALFSRQWPCQSFDPEIFFCRPRSRSAASASRRSSRTGG